MIQSLLRHFYRSLINFFRIDYEPKQLSKSAIIFAPHQDDEILGCGGTIIRKKQAGADIKIVFMTDGCTSHSHLMSEQELKNIRREEAIAAAQKLGVGEHDVIFLDIKDGTLSNNINSVIPRVANILINFLPEEIFIPYSQDGVPDHDVTNHIVIAALRQCELSTIIYEYPVWFWHHYPWTKGVEHHRKKSFFFTNFIPGLNLIKEFNKSVYIGDVLESKRTALNEHKSQVSELIPHPHWLTLHSVSQGEFVDCFFQDYEFFRETILDLKF